MGLRFFFKKFHPPPSWNPLLIETSEYENQSHLPLTGAKLGLYLVKKLPLQDQVQGGDGIICIVDRNCRKYQKKNDWLVLFFEKIFKIIPLPCAGGSWLF